MKESSDRRGLHRRWLILALLAAGSTAAIETARCPSSFEAAVEQTVAAINSRDIERFMATIPRDGEPVMVLPDGSLLRGRGEIERMHTEWFEDESFVFNTATVRTDVREAVGTGLYRVTVDRPDKPGSPFLLGLTFLRGSDGCWTLFADQNTLLPETGD